jgi:hypothetical protein
VVGGLRHPTEGKTHPQTSAFTISQIASSLAIQSCPLKDGRYEWQSAVATSPFNGQAVPTGTVPAPEQIAPLAEGMV